MSKNKGVSFAEKQQRLLKAMYESNEFFTLKELEMMAKRVGIIPQATKEVVQSLLDDSLIKNEKVGSQNIFWALTSEARMANDNMIAVLQNKILHLSKEVSALQYNLKSREQASGDQKSWQHNIEEYKALKEKQAKLQKELTAIKAAERFDIGTMQKEIGYAEEAIQRWSDNWCTVTGWIKNRTGVSEKKINQQFDMSANKKFSILFACN